MRILQCARQWASKIEWLVSACVRALALCFLSAARLTCFSWTIQVRFFAIFSRSRNNFQIFFALTDSSESKEQIDKKNKTFCSAFGVLYSLGTITSLIGTGFLRGPVKQLKALTDTSRLVAVLVMFLMIALTICASVWWKMGILALIFCGLQFLSYMWYCLSYIPYGRDAVTKCFKSCVWKVCQTKINLFLIIPFLLFYSRSSTGFKGSEQWLFLKILNFAYF